MSDDTLLTTREVADRLRWPGKVLRWTRQGDLPGFRLPGSLLRFRQSDLSAWLEARSTLRPDDD